MVGYVGLLQEIEGAGPHGFDGHGHVAMAGDEDDLGGQGALADGAQEVEAGQAGHADIGEDDVGPDIVEHGQGLGGVGGDMGGEAGEAEPLFEGGAHHFFVVDDEDGLGGHADGLPNREGRLLLKTLSHTPSGTSPLMGEAGRGCGSPNIGTTPHP